MFHIVKGIHPTRGGVDAEVHWFTDDPTDARDLLPYLNDRIPLPATRVADVTSELLDAAIARREAELTAEIDADRTPPAAVAALVGTPRAKRAGKYERTRP